MKASLLLIITVALSACSVSFKSNQLNTLSALLNDERKALASDLWFISFEGHQHEAYAFVNEDRYRLYSLEYLEVDVEKTYIKKILVPTPIQYGISFTPTQAGFNIYSGLTGETYTVNCDNLRQASTFIYTQRCYTSDNTWQFQNELQVNEQKDIVFMKNFYSPSKPPIALYYGQLLKNDR